MRSPILRLAAIAVQAVSFAEPGSLRAQSVVPVSISERVRITTAAPEGALRYVGRVVSAGDTIIVESSPGFTHSIPVARITTLEVSAGIRSHGRRGMRYGSAIGAGFGLLFVLANPQIHCPDPSICTTSPDKMSRGEELAGGVVGGGLLGLAVGGIYGVTRKSERWIRRPLGTTAVGASLVTRGTGIGVRLRF